MSYLKEMEYEIIPTESYQIIRGCAGCGCKQNFINTGKFRVNANGNQLDAWLIYQCEKCGHTYNLPLYERVRPGKIPKNVYEGFLANDEELAFQYGTDKTVFSRGRAEVAWEKVRYKLVSAKVCDYDLERDSLKVFLHNPYQIPVREEKIAADILQVSRSRIKKLQEKERLFIELV